MAENQIMVTARKANAMIREYTNNFKSLIEIGQMQAKTINAIVVSTKRSSLRAGKLFKWLKNEKQGVRGGVGETESDPAIDCWHVKMNNF